MPWVPLLMGCLVGLAVSVAGWFRASPTDQNLAAGLLICRAGSRPSWLAWPSCWPTRAGK
jgi:hypothetical protein